MKGLRKGAAMGDANGAQSVSLKGILEALTKRPCTEPLDARPWRCPKVLGLGDPLFSSSLSSYL